MGQRGRLVAGYEVGYDQLLCDRSQDMQLIRRGRHCVGRDIDASSEPDDVAGLHRRLQATGREPLRRTWVRVNGARGMLHGSGVLMAARWRPRVAGGTPPGQPVDSRARRRHLERTRSCRIQRPREGRCPNRTRSCRYEAREALHNVKTVRTLSRGRWDRRENVRNVREPEPSGRRVGGGLPQRPAAAARLSSCASAQEVALGAAVVEARLVTVGAVVASEPVAAPAVAGGGAAAVLALAGAEAWVRSRGSSIPVRAA